MSLLVAGAGACRPPLAARLQRAAMVLWACGVGVPVGVGAQEASTGPVDYRELTALVLNKVLESRIRVIVAGRGCAFALSSSQEGNLRDLGASEELLRVVAALCGGAGRPSSAPGPQQPAPPAIPLGTGFGAEQFVRIAPGRFQMGSASGFEDERPVRSVTLTRPFLLQKTEVTQGQWQAVMGTNPSHFSACGAQCPVEQVSWDDIQQFLARLNARDPGKGYRLPTEAEWEYAARAETSGDYGGTGVLDEMGWYGGNSGETTHPAAQKRPNAWGLYDMHGNVWEWVADWFDGYSGEANTDPRGPSIGEARVLRGGSWNLTAGSARSAFRSYYSPSNRTSSVGFRLARTP